MIPPFIQKAYWWTARRVFGTRQVGALDFVYIDADKGRTESEIETILAGALRLITIAKGGFGELVTSHLRLVASLNVRNPYACASVRAYVSPFRGYEATNTEYLACQLVWAATYIRLSRDSLGNRVTPDIVAIRRAAFEAQLRFVRQLEHSEEWSHYLLDNHPESR